MKGNAGGKKGRSGRKSKAEEMGLVALLNECVTDADRKALFRALLRKGKAGDVKAAGLLLGYIYGTPKQTIEHGGELEHTHKVVRVPPKMGKDKWSPPSK